MLNLQDELIISNNGQGMYEITNNVHDWIVKKYYSELPIYRDFYPRYPVSEVMDSKTINPCSDSDRFNFLVRARRIS